MRCVDNVDGESASTDIPVEFGDNGEAIMGLGIVCRLI